MSIMEDRAITILDGSFSTGLEKKGYTMDDDPLWTARYLYTNPSAICDVYKSYVECGCDIITTASYQASVDGFQKHLNVTCEEGIDLIKLSVELAQQAISESSDQCHPLIAGSVGPYGAALADGSEYSGSYSDNITHEELVQWHRPRLQALIEAGVDMVAFETIPSLKEAEALMQLLREFPGVKAWLSFSTRSDHQISHGEDIGTAAKRCTEIAPAGQLIAVGVNCCPPSHVESLLTDISVQVPGFPLIAYPNSGEKWASQVGWVGTAEKAIFNYIKSWLGISEKIIIGGCCRSGPEDIAQIIKTVKL